MFAKNSQIRKYPIFSSWVGDQTKSRPIDERETSSSPSSWPISSSLLSSVLYCDSLMLLSNLHGLSSFALSSWVVLRDDPDLENANLSDFSIESPQWAAASESISISYYEKISPSVASLSEASSVESSSAGSNWEWICLKTGNLAMFDAYFLRNFDLSELLWYRVSRTYRWGV